MRPLLGVPSGSVSRESSCNAGNLDSIPGLGRSPEKEMATHSSILAWRVPWTGEPGGLQSVGTQSQVPRDDWHFHFYDLLAGFPRWLSGEGSICQCWSYRRNRFDPWVGKIPWRRRRQPTPATRPGKFHRAHTQDLLTTATTRQNLHSLPC